MKILREFILLAIVLVVSYFSAVPIGGLYETLFPTPSSIFLVDPRFFIGFPLVYIFLLSLFFTAFGGNKKYWWTGILLIPAVIFEVYFDFSHVYFPIALGLVGWLLGFLISKFLLKAA